MAIRFRSAWNNRRFKSDLWLWTFSVGGVVIVHDIWTLWIASKKIRHGGNSRFVYRNVFARRVCLPRAIHAQRSYHVRDDLDRARHLYRRSGYPMAFGADTRSSNIARGISI